MLYKDFLRSLLFTLPPEAAHVLGMTALTAARPAAWALRPYLSVDDAALRVAIGSGPRVLNFTNPVGVAAGFDKDAQALHGLAALGFGFIEAGTLTPKPQPGNPKPRLFRFPESQAVINRMGFNNDGAFAAGRRVARHGKPAGVPIGFNVGKNKGTPLDRAALDYESCVETLFPFADYFVLNISSPNTPGLRDLQGPAYLGPLLRGVASKADTLARAAGRPRPLLFVKISPDEYAGDAVVEAALAAGFDGIVATNTTRSREGVGSTAPTDGGLSGAPLRARSTEVIRQLARAAKGRLIVIGVGGIFTAEDAYEKILAGASLVQVYTGFIYEGPLMARRINQGLLRLLRRDGLSNIQQAVGKGL